MRGNSEPKAMAEIHKIREKLWEETKGLNLHQKMQRIKEGAEEFKHRHSLRMKTA